MFKGSFPKSAQLLRNGSFEYCPEPTQYKHPGKARGVYQELRLRLSSASLPVSSHQGKVQLVWCRCFPGVLATL